MTQRDFRFVVVTHGQASDPFWSVAANGVDAAAEDMGVTVEYQAPGTFDMVAMSAADRRRRRVGAGRARR